MASLRVDAVRLRFRLRVAALLCAVAVAASCAGDAPPPGEPQSPPKAQVPAESVAAVPPAAPAVPAAPAKKQIEFDPAKLVGMNEAALIELLGTPAFTRRDAPAQLWRYRHASCVLDLYLYSAREAPDGVGRVRHFEARGVADGDITARACVIRLLEARAADKADRS